MKHFIKATLLLLALLLPTLTHAHDIEVDGIYYYIIGTTAFVTYKGSSPSQYSNEYSGSVTIPATVTYNNKTYPVTFISYSAFRDCSNLTNINIPNSVTSIGSYAFSSCSSLTNINIPKSVTSIIGGAFAGCSNLTNINIPNSVTTIGYKAFNNCSGLTTINIPNSVTTIKPFAFSGCSSLATISVASDNPKYNSRNNCNAIIETATNTLIAGCKNTTIPNSVTYIGEGAFNNCSSLTTINIPNSVTYIGSYAFSGCSSLTTINIPNSVTAIGYDAFSGTSWYDNQPDGLVYAGLVAYEYKGTKPEGTTITLKEGTKGIADYAFSNCSNLAAINIPNSVTYIGEGAFSDCIHLNDLYCYATTPPKCCQSTFTNILSKTNSTTLHVPAASLAAYRAAPVWKDYKNIVGDAVAPTGIATSRNSVETQPGE